MKRLEDEGEAVQLKRGINQQLCVTHSTQLPQWAQSLSFFPSGEMACKEMPLYSFLWHTDRAARTAWDKTSNAHSKLFLFRAALLCFQAKTRCFQRRTTWLDWIFTALSDLANIFPALKARVKYPQEDALPIPVTLCMTKVLGGSVHATTAGSIKALPCSSRTWAPGFLWGAAWLLYRAPTL